MTFYRILALIAASAALTAVSTLAGAQSDGAPLANSATLAATAPTAVPALVSYSGVAIGGDSKPLTGDVPATFLLFKEEQGGEPLFSETQNRHLKCRRTLQGASRRDALQRAASRPFCEWRGTLARGPVCRRAAPAACLAGQRALRAKGRRRDNAGRFARFRFCPPPALGLLPKPVTAAATSSTAANVTTTNGVWISSRVFSATNINRLASFRKWGQHWHRHGFPNIDA